MAILLGLSAIVESIIVGVLPSDRPLNLIGHVLSTLLFGFVIWSAFLLFTCAGYWVAFAVSRRFGIGRGQLSIATLMGFVAIFAAVAAMARLNR